MFSTVCDNLNKCILNTLQFVHGENGQNPEERVAVIKLTTHQGIGCKDSSLICQILSNPPEIIIIIIIIEAFTWCKIDEHPLMCWKPKRGGY